MRICKKNIHYQDNRNEIVRRKEFKEGPTIFTCSYCKYECNRFWNMERHKDRIHGSRISRTCCGEIFYTKGDYYVHCEKWHPETRPNSIMSRTKYKMVSDMVPVHRRRDSDFRVNEKFVNEKRDNPYNTRSKSKCSSEIVQNRTTTQVETKISLQYSVDCRNLDLEDIPLLNFFTDQRFEQLAPLNLAKERFEQFAPLNLARQSFEQFAPLDLVKKRNTESEREGAVEESRTVKIAISSTQNIEQTVSVDMSQESIRTKISESSVSSFSDRLPTKKLLLQRFRSDVHECEFPPLRETNNNDRGTANFMEKPSGNIADRGNTRNARQKKAKHAKHKIKHAGSKENISKRDFRTEQQLDINLGRGIEVPAVTRMHRKYLQSIDFEKYKIF